MDITLGNLLLSKKCDQIDSDCLKIYLLMRADVVTEFTATSKLQRNQGLLTTGFSIDDLRERTGLNALTIRRKLDDLCRLRWVELCDGAYVLGKIHEGEFRWLVTETKGRAYSRKVTDVIRRKLDEDKRRREAACKITGMKVSEAIKDKVSREVGLKPKAPVELLNFYKTLAKDKFGHVPSMPAGKTPSESTMKAYAYLKRYAGWCGNDVKTAKEIMIWMFEYWDRIKPLMKIKGELSIGMICTNSIFERVVKWKVKGIPEEVEVDREGVGTRADKSAIDKAKDSGW